MFRLLVVPISVGVLVFLVTYFLAPSTVPEPGVVAYVADFSLDFSNAFFETMPSIIASYIANLNLLLVALTVALLSTLVIQLVVIAGGILIGIARWLRSILQKDRSKEVVQDLSPIDMDSRFMGSGPGKKILGRGLDSLDRE